MKHAALLTVETDTYNYHSVLKNLNTLFYNVHAHRLFGVLW
jgi:hypothetical protein